MYGCRRCKRGFGTIALKTRHEEKCTRLRPVVTIVTDALREKIRVATKDAHQRTRQQTYPDI